MPPDPPQLRASDADREATAERLRTAAIEGRLDPYELDERLSAVYGARLCSELERLTADVTPPAPPPAQRPVFVQPASRTNGFAIGSFVLGLVWMWWLGSLAAIACGHVALRQIARSGGTQSGRGLAIAGLVFGYLAAVVLLIILVGVAITAA
ncbi:MAG: DUF1707 and DUF4190 domain-containing protein [Solirubrobacteraceae bacterium]